MRAATRPGTSSLPGRVHESAAVHLLRRVLVVRSAEQPDAGDVVQVRAREAFDVIELERARFCAAVAARIDESATATVPLVNCALDRVGDVARIGLGRFCVRTRFAADGEALLLDIVD